MNIFSTRKERERMKESEREKTNLAKKRNENMFLRHAREFLLHLKRKRRQIYIFQRT
jgi:hypothetical protein